MRITQKSIFDMTSYRLGQLTEDLHHANRVVTTGKRINQISDDPVGISRTLDLRSGIAHLEQLDRNISTGRTWLDAAETAMRSAETLLVDTRVLAIAMRNDTMNATDRANAAVQVQETLMELFGIANTRVNGQYLFAGTKTDTMPFHFDDPADPTLVGYNGNETGFAVKTGKDTAMTVGFPGEEVFSAATITIDETNQHLNFMEDVGLGLSAELTAVIPLGTYTKTELAKIVEVSLETASANAVQYAVTYDDATRRFTIAEDGGPLLTEVQLLWGSGTNAKTGIGADLGFDATDDAGGVVFGSDTAVQWGIFRTLFDLKAALLSNDTDGMAKSITRLIDHANRMSDNTSKIGYKGISLDVKENMISDLTLSAKTQKASIEEADFIAAISKVQAKELAYQAALSSSSKVMKLSLLDYL